METKKWIVVNMCGFYGVRTTDNYFGEELKSMSEMRVKRAQKWSGMRLQKR